MRRTVYSDERVLKGRDSMISHTKDKKKLKFGAVWLWCIGEGYEENEMLSYIEKAKGRVQYIYIVIDDNSKYRNLEKFCQSFVESFVIQMHLVWVW